MKLVQKPLSSETAKASRGVVAAGAVRFEAGTDPEKAIGVPYEARGFVAQVVVQVDLELLPGKVLQVAAELGSVTGALEVWSLPSLTSLLGLDRFVEVGQRLPAVASQHQER